MSGIEFGIWVQPTVSPQRVAEWARLVEDEGFDFLGICDGHTIWHDPYPCLTLAALATRRVRLGPWVTTPVLRHITVTASNLCTLDDLSGGRALLGVGIGDESVTSLGHRPARLDELREAVDAVRRLWQGEHVDGPGGGWHLAIANGPKPIYWACANPRSLEYAGRYADGAIVSGWLVDELLAESAARVAHGARVEGRPPQQVPLIFNTGFAVSDDGAQARAAARPYVARALCYASSARVPGWSAEARDRFLARYHYDQHFASGHDLAELVPDAMVTRKAVAGTPEQCAELLQRVIDAGFTKLALTPMGDVEGNIARLARQVIPRLEARG